MAKKRPTSALVFGILHITFGTLGLLGALCGGGATLVGLGWMKQMYQQQAASAPTPQQKEVAEYQVRQLEMQQNIPYYMPYLVVSLALGTILCVLLIVAGSGLIRFAGWGRTLSLSYAVLSLLIQLLQVVYILAIYVPAHLAFADHEIAVATSPAISPMATGTRIGAYVGAGLPLLGLIYPTIVLIWFLRPSVVEAFRKGGVEVSEPNDYDDRDRREPPDYDDRPWRERENQGGEGFTPK